MKKYLSFKNLLLTCHILNGIFNLSKTKIFDKLLI